MNRTSSKKKILYVATSRLMVDGLTAMLVKIAQIACTDYDVCFALAEGGTQEQIAAISRIGEVFFLPSRKDHLLYYMFSLYRLVCTRRIDIVHIHGNSATMAFDLLAAKYGGVPRRIAHCHNCKKQSWLKQKTLGVLCNKLVTDPVACSATSGEMLYRKPFRVLTNGVDCERFSFSAAERNRVRKEFGLEDAFVVGHIGRFTAQKNQKRLIDIFVEILKRKPNAWLLLGGDGEEKNSCMDQAARKGLAGRVIFLGNVKKTEHFFCAMDVFVLPSLFEGLPLVGVEAQANGLPCVFSDAITREAKILPQTVFLPLGAEDARWAEAIVRMTPKDREDAAKQVAEAGFHEQKLKDQVKELYG